MPYLVDLASKGGESCVLLQRALFGLLGNAFGVSELEDSRHIALEAFWNGQDDLSSMCGIALPQFLNGSFQPVYPRRTKNTNQKRLGGVLQTTRPSVNQMLLCLHRRVQSRQPTKRGDKDTFSNDSAIGLFPSSVQGCCPSHDKPYDAPWKFDRAAGGDSVSGCWP